MISSTTTLSDLAFIVYRALKDAGIKATLSGGAVVSVYSRNKYESRDLDFIAEADRSTIDAAMATLNFDRRGKNYWHQNARFTVEFPSGPLAIGDELIQLPRERVIRGRALRLLSPTDAIKDRLAGFFYFKDPQNLEQAKLLYREVGGNLSKVRAWAKAEGAEDKFNVFIRSLKAARTSE